MGKKKNAAPAARREEAPVVLTLIEVDPAVLDAIRKKNSAALTSILNPCNELSDKDISNAADAVWHLVTNGHHATGNLNLLTDLTPVCDRWVQSLTGAGPIMQLRARGSVNCNGIRLDDICATPSWYMVSNAAEHMTGNLHLLKNFTPTRPGLPVRKHTSAMLLVHGKGSLISNQLFVSGVSYVLGLSENITSVTHLTDSGFSVMFEPKCCTVRRNRDGSGSAWRTHAGGQLYCLDYLRVAPSK